MGKNTIIQTSLAPWFEVANAVKAVDFYKSAFGTSETYRMETSGGLVVKLSIDGAEFWISGGFTDPVEVQNQSLGGGSIRMILTVADPDTLFEKALKAGATEIYSIREEYGWRLGRLTDPFGLHWEIGHPIETE